MYTALPGGRKAKQTVIKHFIGNKCRLQVACTP